MKYALLFLVLAGSLAGCTENAYQSSPYGYGSGYGGNGYGYSGNDRYYDRDYRDRDYRDRDDYRNRDRYNDHDYDHRGYDRDYRDNYRNPPPPPRSSGGSFNTPPPQPAPSCPSGTRFDGKSCIITDSRLKKPGGDGRINPCPKGQWLSNGRCIPG